MGKVVESLLDLIGDTPMVRLRNLPGQGAAEVWAKLEFMNPGGSIKDRTCLGMIEAAEAEGRLKPGATIIEPTAGNTGVGAALIAALKGYKVICVMPEKFRGEKPTLIQAMGGEVVFTPTVDGMTRSMEVVEQMLGEIEGSISLGQFTNPANPEVHERTTGAEMLEQLQGRVDALVLGAGTGGTFTGVARAFQRALPGCKRVLVQPVGSVFDGSEAQPYKVEGIGSTFIPETLDLELADEIRSVADATTFETVKALARREGILVGGSSGAIATVALQVARELGEGKRVACVFPDAAERYMSKFQFDHEET